MVFDATVMVMADVPLPGAGMVLGLNPTVTPEGMPEADKAIELLNPARAVVVIVDEPCPPCATLTEFGEAEMLKSGCCGPQLGNFSDASRVLQSKVAVTV